MAIHAKVGIWKHNIKLRQTRATHLRWSCSSLKASHVLTQKLSFASLENRGSATSCCSFMNHVYGDNQLFMGLEFSQRDVKTLYLPLSDESRPWFV